MTQRERDFARRFEGREEIEFGDPKKWKGASEFGSGHSRLDRVNTWLESEADSAKDKFDRAKSWLEDEFEWWE